MRKDPKTAESLDEYIQILREQVQLENFYKFVTGSDSSDSDESDSKERQRNLRHPYMREEDQ